MMQTRNSCYTYFQIVGDFDPDEVTRLLALQPEKTWKIGDRRKNGAKYNFALWEIGRCKDYGVEVEKQMRKTLGEKFCLFPAFSVCSRVFRLLPSLSMNVRIPLDITSPKVII